MTIRKKSLDVIPALSVSIEKTGKPKKSALFDVEVVQQFFFTVRCLSSMVKPPKIGAGKSKNSKKTSKRRTAALTLSVRRVVLNFVADPIENPHGMSRIGPLEPLEPLEPQRGPGENMDPQKSIGLSSFCHLFYSF